LSHNRVMALALAAILVGSITTNNRVNGSLRASSDTVTTVDFEGYPPGTQITNQYSGITFEYPTAAAFTLGTPANGVVSADVGGPPLVVASGAHSGTNAGELIPPSEFSAVGTFVALSNLADTVSVYIGDQSVAGVHVELDAYDSNRALLGSGTALTSSTGAHTLLTYSTGGPGKIAYVAIYRSDHNGDYGVIDDLTVDTPPTTTPLVGATTSTTTYELGQGGTRDLPVTVARLDGATGPVTLSLTGLPPGVSGTFSENPVAATDTGSILTLTAASNASSGNFQVSLSASASGAGSQPAAVFTLSIIDALQLAAASSVQVGACSTARTTIYANVAPGRLGPVTFAVTTSSPGLTSALSSIQAAVTDSEAQTTLTLASAGGTGPATADVTATLPGGPTSQVNIPVQLLGPQVTSMDAMGTSSLGTPVAGLLAYTPRALHPGTTVEVTGHNFCNTATVAFGNPQASVTATVKHYVGNQGPYDYIRVTTPRFATSGPVTVTSGSPAISASSSSSLIVDSYRNAEAFNFPNFYPQLTFQDLTDAFGSQQTYINVNPCGILTLGLANCSVALVPDPTALAWLAIADAAMANGTCFGISLTDARLLSGQIDLRSFPRSGDLIYDLSGPKVDSDHTARGNEPLLVQLKASHLMQLSTEFLSQFSARATAQSVMAPSAVVSSIVKEIDGVFAAGRYPMIELNDGNGGGGHVVVAYDLTPVGNGAVDIYVYDSNNPYGSTEDSDGNAHAAAVESSIIHLRNDGTWSLASTTEPSNAAFQGGPSAIVVTDPAIIPLHPTLGTLGGAAPGLLFSSAGAPGSAGANQAGAARVTQLTGAGGKTLYSKNGVLNSDATTRLDAVPFAPFVAAASSAAHSPQMFVVGPGVKQLTVSTNGSEQGSSAETLVDGGFVGTAKASVQKGARGQTSFSSTAGAVGFNGTSTAPVQLSVDRVGSTGSEGVQATTTGNGKAGSTTLMLQGNGVIALSHSGAPTTFSLTMSSEPRNGLPSSFTSAPISLASGKTAIISSVNWKALANSSVIVRIGKRLVQLHNRARTVHLATISKLRVTHGSRGKVQLLLTGRLASLPGGTTAAAVWVVRQGKHVLARHEFVLQVHSGTFTSSWTVPLRSAQGLTFTAEVVAVGRQAAAEVSAAVSSSVKFSVP
jgi:hypothetical protein